MATFFRWQFIESHTLHGPRWIWQCTTIDGSIAMRSPEFEDYGEAAVHAIQSGGFRPKSEGWTIITLHGLTHFTPGTSVQKAHRHLPKRKAVGERSPLRSKG